jgi:hypothetical protein
MQDRCGIQNPKNSFKKCSLGNGLLLVITNYNNGGGGMAELANLSVVHSGDPDSNLGKNCVVYIFYVLLSFCKSI